MDEKWEYYRENGRFIFSNEIPEGIRLEVLDYLIEDEWLSEQIFELIKLRIEKILFTEYQIVNTKEE